MKARLWLVLFVLLLILSRVAGTLTIPAALAQGPTYTLYLPLVQAPPAVQVLSNHYAYQTSWGTLHIVGEVENNSATPIHMVKIPVDFYDANHHMVANDYTYLSLDDLPSGDKSCFDMLISPAPSYASYEFELPSYWIATPQTLNLTLVDPTASYNSSTGQYRIIGLVRNDGATQVKYVDVTGTAYNAAGTVVGCTWTYLNNTTLSPGQSSSFTLGFSGRNESDVASWRLQMDGTPE